MQAASLTLQNLVNKNCLGTDLNGTEVGLQVLDILLKATHSSFHILHHDLELKWSMRSLRFGVFLKEAFKF